MHETRQIVLVHLSDIHFGSKHRFNPPTSPSGDVPKEYEYPTLHEKLQEDLDQQDPNCPVIICITGDFAETASLAEFNLAEKFIDELASTPLLGKERSKDSIFIVPGNHDVSYDHPEVGFRWQQYTEFHNRLFNKTIRREDPWSFVELYDKIEEFGVLVLCLNSAIFVEKETEDQERGRLDIKQLGMVEETLEAFPKDKLKSAIKVALIHHHPVLIPALAEPERGYDAVLNSGKLLSILRRHGFQLVLHGHKHNPHIFTDDVNPAYQTSSDQPILIVAGGSSGSTGLPNFPKRCNCYNKIIVKWHPEAQQTRLQVETRGLQIFNEDGSERLPNRWKWETLKVDDRSFFGGQQAPLPHSAQGRSYKERLDEEADKRRTAEYERTRGNLPVVEVLPSLVPGQAYEARLWIVHHGAEYDRCYPTEVIWSAGSRFPVITVRRDNDPNFCATYNYWGPMLVQARLIFEDGTSQLVHVYARMPRDYGGLRTEGTHAHA